MRKEKPFLKKRTIVKGEVEREKKIGHIICYECRKPSHYRLNYSLLKKNHKKKKKAFVAIWSDSEESSSEDEQQEEANLCLMAHDDEVNFESSFDFIFEELYNAFNELMTDYKKLGKKSKK